MAEPTDGTVLVTGASGFIALHIIQLLQREGFKVRGTVRSLKNDTKMKPLRNLCPDAKHNLELVEADLTRDDCWTEAVRGCHYVLHVASPFPSVPPKHESDLIRPAVDGTLRVLKACAESGSVRRVVLTSSISAVHGHMTNESDRIFTEDDWTDIEHSTLDTYSKSKTLAEKAAWDFIQSLEGEKKLELVVINPALVMGPMIGGVVCTSLELLKRLMDGTMPLIPHIHLSICDVRDVAVAHLKAMSVPEAKNNRHLIASAHLWLRDASHIIKEEFSPFGYFVPTWPAPYFCLWFYSFVDSSTRLILSRINKVATYSNKRMKEVLNVQPRDIKDTLIDSVHGLIESGAVKKTKRYKLANS